MLERPCGKQNQMAESILKWVILSLLLWAKPIFQATIGHTFGFGPGMAQLFKFSAARRNRLGNRWTNLRGRLKFRPAQNICPWQPPYPLCHSLAFFKTRRCNGGGLPFGSNGKSTIYRQLFLIFHVQESSKDFPLQCLIARGCNLAWPNSKWPVSGQAPEAAPEARK